MDVRLMYSINNRTDMGGFTYSVTKRYQNTKKQIEKPKATKPIAIKGKREKPKNKVTFIDQYVSIHKMVPGADAYFKKDKKSKSSPRLKRIDFEAQMKKGTKTFIDQIIKQSSKVPGVGNYNPEVDKTQEIRKAYKYLHDKVREKIPSFRYTAIGDENPNTTGPGDYQPYGSFQLGHSGSSYAFSPLKKQEQAVKIKDRSKSLSKLPGPASYNAQPAGADTFSKKLALFQSNSGKGKLQTGLTTSQRSSLPQIVGPGPKYSLISQWATKKGTAPTLSKNLFKLVSLPRSPSVYY